MTAAFMWTETVHKGKVRYQEGTTVQPGDIMATIFHSMGLDLREGVFG